VVQWIRNRLTAATLEPIFWMVGAIIVIELLTRAFNIPAYFIPAPSRIIMSFFKNSSLLMPNFVVTLEEVILGFMIGFAIGMGLAILIVHSGRLQRGLYPLLSFFQSVPKGVLAAIFIVWFGFGFLPKLLVTFLTTFFAILVSSLAGLAISETELLDLMRSLHASKLQILVKIRLPRSLPFVFSGLQIAGPLSVIGAVNAEFMVGNVGLGYIVMVANWQVDMPLLFASIALMSLIGLGMFWAIVALERHFAWYKKE
jgi:NitT/TauT family transport system permease protein